MQCSIFLDGIEFYNKTSGDGSSHYTVPVPSML